MMEHLVRGHVAVYRATSGRLGHRVPGTPPMLLLEHTGARSGMSRTTPLAYMPHEESFIVVGANLGQQRNPAWVHNLRATPDARVQVGAEKLDVHATEADAEERQRLWPELVRYNPAWQRYQRRTQRPFPVVILSRAGASPAE